MSDELEDELQGLLEELDEREEDLVESTLSEQPELEPEKSEEPDPLDDAEDIDDEDVDIAMRPIDVRKMSPDNNISVSEYEEPVGPPPLPVEIENYKRQLEEVTNEVLDACRSDRQEAQDVINDLRARIQASSGANGAPTKALVDGLVQAVQVKAGINTNAIKIMDTNARFLSSIKPSINTQNNVNFSSSEDLKKILDNPVDGA